MDNPAVCVAPLVRVGAGLSDLGHRSSCPRFAGGLLIGPIYLDHVRWRVVWANRRRRLTHVILKRKIGVCLAAQFFLPRFTGRLNFLFRARALRIVRDVHVNRGVLRPTNSPLDRHLLPIDVLLHLLDNLIAATGQDYRSGKAYYQKAQHNPSDCPSTHSAPPWRKAPRRYHIQVPTSSSC
jgi:hypothetical protein